MIQLCHELSTTIRLGSAECFAAVFVELLKLNRAMFDSLELHDLPNLAEQLWILMAECGIPLQMNRESDARSADGPDVQVMNTLHTWHRLQIGQNGCGINPVRNFIHQFGQAVSQQHDPEPSQAQADSETCDWIDPCPAGEAGHEGTQQHRCGDSGIPEQVENGCAAVQIVMVI